MVFEVFISYSSRDLTRAKQVKRILGRPGCSVFLAESSIVPGETLDAVIITAIKRCDLFLLLWSHHAKRSDWVPQEIGVAKAQHKPIIPVCLHQSAIPTGFLRGTKYMRLYEDPTRNLAWLQNHVFQAASAKQQREGAMWLGLGAAILWLVGQNERSA